MSFELLIVSPDAIDEYCRLCARRAPPPRLRSFAKSGPDADSLLASIRRLEHSIYRADGLPQSACLDCLRLLNAVDVFQRGIAAAQVKLNDIIDIGKLQEDRVTLKEETDRLSFTDEYFQSNNQEYISKYSSKRPETSAIVMENENHRDYEHISAIQNQPVKLAETSVIKEECTLKEELEDSNSSNRYFASSNEHEDHIMTSLPLECVLHVKNEVDHPKGESDENVSTPYEQTALNVEVSHESTLNPALDQSSEKIPALSPAEMPMKKHTECKIPQVAEPSASSTLRTRVAATTWRTAPTPSLEPGPRFTDYMYCRRCDLRFDSLQPLREHSWSEHARCISFKCIYCTKRILTFKHFYQHYPRHVAALRHCCEFCNERFEFVADVKLHKKLLHVAEKKAHRCVICGMKFSTAAELKTHRDNYTLVTSSTAGGKNFKCSLCPKAFTNKIGLVGHMNSHDPTKNVCNICNKSYTNKNILKQHLNTVHKDIFNFICHICGKGFKSKSNYNVHIGIHYGIKRFCCDTCAKTFRNKNSLREHLVSHTENYLHVCKICNKTYKYNSSLKEHLNSHNKERPYSCDLCPKTFLSWGNFNKHMKRIHDKNMSKKKQLLVKK